MLTTTTETAVTSFPTNLHDLSSFPFEPTFSVGYSSPFVHSNPSVIPSSFSARPSSLEMQTSEKLDGDALFKYLLLDYPQPVLDQNIQQPCLDNSMFETKDKHLQIPLHNETTTSLPLLQQPVQPKTNRYESSFQSVSLKTHQSDAFPDFQPTLDQPPFKCLTSSTVQKNNNAPTSISNSGSFYDIMDCDTPMSSNSTLSGHATPIIKSSTTSSSSGTIIGKNDEERREIKIPLATQTKIDKADERRRRNRESSSRCYYNRKKITDALNLQICSEKRRLTELYDRALDLRHENSRLKRAVVTQGIPLPMSRRGPSSKSDHPDTAQLQGFFSHISSNWHQN